MPDHYNDGTLTREELAQKYKDGLRTSEEGGRSDLDLLAGNNPNPVLNPAPSTGQAGLNPIDAANDPTEERRVLTEFAQRYENPNARAATTLSGEDQQLKDAIEAEGGTFNRPYDERFKPLSEALVSGRIAKPEFNPFEDQIDMGGTDILDEASTPADPITTTRLTKEGKVIKPKAPATAGGDGKTAKATTDDDLRSAWAIYKDPDSSDLDKGEAERLLLANKDHILERRQKNRERRAERERIPGTIEQLASQERKKRDVQIDNDLKTLGLSGTKPEREAMGLLRDKGLDAFDYLGARTAMARNGQGLKFDQSTVAEQIGYTQLHDMSKALGGNRSTNFGRRSRHGYTAEGAELAKGRALQALVDSGRISPAELATGDAITYKKNGEVRINTGAVNEVMGRAKKELISLERGAKQMGLKTQQLKYAEEVREFKAQQEVERSKAAMETTTLSDGFQSKSLLEVMDSWYAQQSQLDELPFTDDKRRKKMQTNADSILDQWGVPDGATSKYLSMIKTGVYKK